MMNEKQACNACYLVSYNQVKVSEVFEFASVSSQNFIIFVFRYSGVVEWYK